MNACIKLQSEGYDSDFWNLEGGINAWAAAGYEIQK
jgi:rhodanese-related sulfurtransferase